MKNFCNIILFTLKKKYCSIPGCRFLSLFLVFCICVICFRTLAPRGKGLVAVKRNSEYRYGRRTSDHHLRGIFQFVRYILETSLAVSPPGHLSLIVTLGHVAFSAISIVYVSKNTRDTFISKS